MLTQRSCKEKQRDTASVGRKDRGIKVFLICEGGNFPPNVHLRKPSETAFFLASSSLVPDHSTGGIICSDCGLVPDHSTGDIVFSECGLIPDHSTGNILCSECGLVLESHSTGDKVFSEYGLVLDHSTGDILYSECGLVLESHSMDEISDGPQRPQPFLFIVFIIYLYVIENMASIDMRSQHGRNPAQRRGVYELSAQDALLAQNKILAQQMELLTQHMAKLPQQLQAMQAQPQPHHQVMRCVLESRSPRDDDGHDTHTASTAARSMVSGERETMVDAATARIPRSPSPSLFSLLPSSPTRV
ncbi:hypothetical protein LR48_Vigan11g154400 [Vigna angularis]|uniref:TFIIB-type domain-containing protein n=1 Tax=Phaseolus angularis TaxID=3914 RepID=A0A0L9VTW8_PHAAN|nr:hypothetical protein LR48_Vigan11g154400 [Vigna angularis]